MCEVCEKVKNTEQYKYGMEQIKLAAADEEQFEILENMVFSIVLSYEVIVGANISMQEMLLSVLNDEFEEDDSDYLIFPVDGDRLN